MRRKRHNRSGVLIDLTSLLDVIFIILLVVLCGQSGLNSDLKESQLDAENAKANAEAEQELYKDMIDTANSLNELVLTASVLVPYDKSEIRKREIKVLIEGEEIQSFLLNGLDTESSLLEFENYLSQYALQNKDRPVILSLNDDDDKILYRDEVAINSIFDELSRNNNNVYIKRVLRED